MKSLLFGVMLVSPAVVVWAYRDTAKAAIAAEIRPISYSPAGTRPPGDVVRIPVEVIEKGSAAKVIYIEATHQAVPEPGIFTLFTFTSLILIFRRKRD